MLKLLKELKVNEKVTLDSKNKETDLITDMENETKMKENINNNNTKTSKLDWVRKLWGD